MLHILFQWYNVVAKKKSLFDDRPMEIQELTYIIKQVHCTVFVFSWNQRNNFQNTVCCPALLIMVLKIWHNDGQEICNNNYKLVCVEPSSVTF